MAHGKPPKSNKPVLLPANVPGIVRELHRLALASDVSAGSQKPCGGAREVNPARATVVRNT